MYRHTFLAALLATLMGAAGGTTPRIDRLLREGGDGRTKLRLGSRIAKHPRNIRNRRERRRRGYDSRKYLLGKARTEFCRLDKRPITRRPRVQVVVRRAPMVPLRRAA